MDLVRVGEGHYSKMNKIPSKHRQAVRKVLKQMRKITYQRVVRNGEIVTPSEDEYLLRLRSTDEF